MPKRSASEKLKRYERKITKLKEKDRLRRILDSDDENVAGSEIAKQDGAINELLEEEPYEPPPVSSLPMNTDATQPVEAEPEPTLDPELLSALGASTSDTPDFGEAIHDSLATLWMPLLRKGLCKEEKEKIAKEHLIPVNCKLLVTPKLNPEIAAAVSDTVRGRDKKLAGFQQTLGQGIAALNRGMDVLLKSDDKIKTLKLLSDSCRLLCDLNYSFTKDRIKLVIPSLEKNVLHVIHDSERDDTLFGNSLGEKIKACKAIEKQGKQIRKPGNQVRPNSQVVLQPLTNRPVHQENWTGPPRYPSFRGGRGGQHRPAPKLIRRPYPTTSTQPTSKGFNQPKNRANTQN